jgi:prophage regulatory protein
METIMDTSDLKAWRALRVRKVSDKTGLGVSSIWRLVNEGQFPAPIKLTAGCTAWFEHEIDQWLEAKALERGTAAQ